MIINNQVATIEKIRKLGEIIADQKVPMKARYRALFTLKNIGGKDAIEAIAKGFQDPSALLKHECAYCLGQMQDSSAIDVLIGVLSDREENPMVRHEAGKKLR
jgi:deoxyhypusine monooxygenase